MSREACLPNYRMNPPAVFALVELLRRVAAGCAERWADWTKTDRFHVGECGRRNVE